MSKNEWPNRYSTPRQQGRIKQRYQQSIPALTERLRVVTESDDAKMIKQIYKDIQKEITEPWEKVVRARPPGKPIWWHKAIGITQRKRRKAAKRWHLAINKSRQWTDGAVTGEAKRANDELKVQKRAVRQLSRQAKEKFDQSAKIRWQEAGITAQSRAVCKDKRGKALRQAEAAKRGKQLRPDDLTAFMGQQQGGGEDITPRRFKTESRKFRGRLKRAIKSMETNKAVGVDKIHAEMLQLAPDLFASLLAQWWLVVGRTGVTPEEWNTGILVPFFKKGEQHEPTSYRPLCMLSHVRKIIEKAVISELEEITKTDRMKFGFQARLSTLQAAVDVAAQLETNEFILAAVLDLTKAYDRVSRQVLIDKLERLGLPRDLINQILIFLLPLRVTTAGDVTSAFAILTVGLVQGGTASPALFRIYINDLAGRLRGAVDMNGEEDGPSTHDPGKLVADDVILIAKSESQLQTLLDICTEWAKENKLDWKPTKCSIIVPQIEGKRYTFSLANQEVPVRLSATYLGLSIKCTGFRKDAGEEIEQKCRRACAAIIGQSFFDCALPTRTIGTLYRMNVRSVLMYGAMLVSNVEELIAIDERCLNHMFRKLLYTSYPLARTLLHRLCIRLRIPSMSMNVEKDTKSWLTKLNKYAAEKEDSKIRRHARDTLGAVKMMPKDTALRKHSATKLFQVERWEVRAFRCWSESTRTGNDNTRALGNITQSRPSKDILESELITTAEKSSALRYIIHKFPMYKTLTLEEDTTLRKLLEQNVWGEDRRWVVQTPMEVHKRELEESKKVEAAEIMLAIRAAKKTGRRKKKGKQVKESWRQ